MNLQMHFKEICQDVLHEIEEPHVSLSKTFILKYHWLNDFFSSLREHLKNNLQFTIQLSPELEFFSNEDKTRFFVCISCQAPELLQITAIADKCLTDFNLSDFSYYKEPSFHISIAWSLRELDDNEKLKLQTIATTIMTDSNNSQDLSLVVSKIICKSGNKILNISLFSS
jgi:hypothetical protein